MDLTSHKNDFPDIQYAGLRKPICRPYPHSPLAGGDRKLVARLERRSGPTSAGSGNWGSSLPFPGIHAALIIRHVEPDPDVGVAAAEWCATARPVPPAIRLTMKNPRTTACMIYTPVVRSGADDCEATSNARHRSLELVHGRSRFPFSTDVL